jgi:hypothetical protein
VFQSIKLKLGCYFSLYVLNVLPVLKETCDKNGNNRCSDVLIGLSILFAVIRRFQVGKNAVVV